MRKLRFVITKLKFTLLINFSIILISIFLKNKVNNYIEVILFSIMLYTAYIPVLIKVFMSFPQKLRINYFLPEYIDIVSLQVLLLFFFVLFFIKNWGNSYMLLLNNYFYIVAIYYGTFIFANNFHYAGIINYVVVMSFDIPFKYGNLPIEKLYLVYLFWGILGIFFKIILEKKFKKNLYSAIYSNMQKKGTKINAIVSDFFFFDE